MSTATVTPTQDAYCGAACNNLPHTGADAGFIGALGLLIVSAGVAIYCAVRS